MADPLIIIAIGVIIFVVYHLLTKNKKKLERIRQEWETGEFQALNEDSKSISSYWKNKKSNVGNYDGIDQLTSDDLAMDEVFKKLNYTQSSVGSEYLFNEIRDIKPELKGVKDKEELYKLLATNHELREEILLILSSLGKQNFKNSSSFFYELNEEKIRNTYFYVVLALWPVVSLLIMFFSINYGIFSFIVAFIVNTLVYYRNKSTLENKLYSITYVAAIVNAGRRLTAVNHREFVAYANEIKENVKPIKRISFWGNLVLPGGGGDIDLFFEYIRMLFMLDFIAYNKIVRTIANYQDEYREIWERIGELDSAIAVAFYRKSLDTYCTPTFVEREELSFEKLAHPLIDNPVTSVLFIRVRSSQGQMLLENPHILKQSRLMQF